MCLSFPWNGTAQCKINDLSHDLWIVISCHHLLQRLWCTVSCSCFLCLHLQLGDSEDLIPTPGALEPTCRSQTSTIPTVWRVSSPAKMASERPRDQGRCFASLWTTLFTFTRDKTRTHHGTSTIDTIASMARSRQRLPTGLNSQKENKTTRPLRI